MYCLVATAFTEPAFLRSLLVKVIEEAFARSYIPDAALETHRSRANSYGPDEDTAIRMSSSLLHLLLPDGAWNAMGFI